MKEVVDWAARSLTAEVIGKIGSRTCYRDTWHPKKFGKRLKRNPRVDEFFGKLAERGMMIRRTGIYPHYLPDSYTIRIPPMNQFKDTASYYNTLCHEAIHLVGDDHFLSRRTLGSDFGTREHCEEEVVAEFGALFFAQFFKYIDKTKKSSIAYINTWAKSGGFENDVDLLRRLANRAYSAFTYILNTYNEREVNECSEKSQPHALSETVCRT